MTKSNEQNWLIGPQFVKIPIFNNLYLYDYYDYYMIINISFLIFSGTLSHMFVTSSRLPLQ